MEKKKLPEVATIAKLLHSKKNEAEYKQSLRNRDKEQLINDFIIEKNAKNRAYYFILESGNFDSFNAYCLNRHIDMN
jgi:hypothetical protein